jgi:HlyD family secretion protein
VQGTWIALSGATLLVLLPSCAQLQVPWPGTTGGARPAIDIEIPQAVATPAAAAGGPEVTTAPAVTGVSRAQATPTQDRVAAAAARGSIAVRRGPIAEELLLNGRIVGVDELPLSFQAGGTVRAIPVDPGQTVKAGQVLMEIDSKQLTKDRDAARAKLDTSLIRVQQAQAKVQAQAQFRQRELERRRREAERQQQTAVAEAERVLRRTMTDLEQVKAGPTAAERSAADAAVAAARSNVERVKADQNRLAKGAEPDEVRTAESQVAAAEAALAAAQAELDKVNRGPGPDEVRAAERNVERAQIAVGAAKAPPADEKASTPASREAAIAGAELTLREAQEKLASLRTGPPAADVDVARRKAEAARLGAEAARQHLERVRKGPDQQALAAANAAVTSAEAALKNALDQVAELNARPKPADVQAAEDKVATAQAALDNARAVIDVPVDEDDSASFDVLVAQKGADQDRAELDALERDLAATKLVAPFAGVIVAIRTQTGTNVEAGRPMVVLARASQPVIEASLFDADAARIARGQQATVQLDGGDGTRLAATVLDFVRNPSGAGTTARIAVDWSNTFPAFGATARIRVAVQQRTDALQVPRLAIRTVGDRQFVEYVDGGARQTAEVQVGILTNEAAEILDGLTEGQLVVIGPQ